MPFTAVKADPAVDAVDIVSVPHEEAQYAIAPVPKTENASCNPGGLLKSAGMRSTRQREAVAKCLFDGPDRHLTAEMLFDELLATGARASLATIYNTLNLMLEAGLLRQVCVDGSKTYFDTNTRSHQHFYFENTRELVDIPGSDWTVEDVVLPSQEYDLARVDVIVRLRKKHVA